MNKYQLRKLRTAKRAEMKRLLDACTAGGEVREMTADESAKFDGLQKQVDQIAGQLDKLLQAEGDEDDERDDDDEVEKPKSEDDPAEPRGRSSRPITARDSPAVHTGGHEYSYLRALQLLDQGKAITGLEGEVSQSIAKRENKHAKGFFLPLGNEPEYRAIVGRASARTRGGRPGGARGEVRSDLTTTTGSGAVFTEPYLPMIELLRNKLVLQRMGCTFLTGMEGKFSIPRQSTAAQASWISEGVSLTPTSGALDQVAFTPKTLGAATNISRKFIYQTSVDAEQFVRNDLAKVLAIAFDHAGINGSGLGAEPLGLLQNSTIAANSAGVQGGPNGAIPTFTQLVNMETQVAAANADEGSLAYLTCPAVKGTLKTTPKVGATYPVFLWDDNEVNGYPAFVTNNVPSNLTKGTAAGVCGGTLFGNWEDLVLAQWGGIDVVVNPFVNQLSGAVTISMLTEGDVEVRHPESFAVVLDALYNAY